MISNKNNRSSKIINVVNKISRSKYHMLIFVIAFAVTGGVFLLLSSQAAAPYVDDPSHGSQCIQNTPSKTAVRPGENFTAVVQIKNTGTSTYSGAFGVSLYDFNYGEDVWSASGKDLSGNVGPGGIATFNLGLKAPSTPGTYKFEWGILIVFQGFIRYPCTGVTITVANPPVVTLLANSQSNNIIMTKGGSLALSWSVTNNPTSCIASGSWGGAKAASGLESRSSDATSAGTRTYTLACSNGVGANSVSRTVTVNNPPVTTTNPNPSTPSTPRTPTSTRTPSQTTPLNTNPMTVIAPPPQPDSFSATVEDESAVKLTWKRPNYDGIVLGYEIERSTDQVKWEKINKETIEDETYTDTDTKYETTYNYRIRTIGQEDKKSSYATTQVTTNQFKSNTSSGEAVLTSEDQRVNVYIPDDAIDEDAQCILRNDNDLLAPAKEKYETFAGPLQILCKKADGSVIGNFKTPVRITINNEKSGFKKLAYYGYATDWQEIKGKIEKNQGSFEIKDQTSFAILGQRSSTPLWVKLLLSIIVLIFTVILGLRILYFIKNKKAQNEINRKSEDYYRKEHGI